MLRSVTSHEKSAAASRSILVITATWPLLKMIGYLSGLSSPSVTDRTFSRSASRRSSGVGVSHSEQHAGDDRVA